LWKIFEFFIDSLERLYYNFVSIICNPSSKFKLVLYYQRLFGEISRRCSLPGTLPIYWNLSAEFRSPSLRLLGAATKDADAVELGYQDENHGEYQDHSALLCGPPLSQASIFAPWANPASTFCGISRENLWRQPVFLITSPPRTLL